MSDIAKNYILHWKLTKKNVSLVFSVMVLFSASLVFLQ